MGVTKGLLSNLRHTQSIEHRVVPVDSEGYRECSGQKKLKKEVKKKFKGVGVTRA